MKKYINHYIFMLVFGFEGVNKDSENFVKRYFFYARRKKNPWEKRCQNQ